RATHRQGVGAPDLDVKAPQGLRRAEALDEAFASEGDRLRDVGRIFGVGAIGGPGRRWFEHGKVMHGGSPRGRWRGGGGGPPAGGGGRGGGRPPRPPPPGA